ncbi:UNVERIFIED_CONTAM: hypothetical protein O8I53_06490 [Campylobacter lari]
MFPNPDYINPYYVFDKVIDVNATNGYTTKENLKIVRLNKYLLNKNPDASDEDINNSVQTLNLGVTYIGNRYKIVGLVEENNELF